MERTCIKGRGRGGEGREGQGVRGGGEGRCEGWRGCEGWCKVWMWRGGVRDGEGVRGEGRYEVWVWRGLEGECSVLPRKQYLKASLDHYSREKRLMGFNEKRNHFPVHSTVTGDSESG